jgi:hypothetical protein
MRDDRIVFQVKASSKSKVGGIVHDVSATNRTFYIEPAQIVPLNNKIREVKSKIYAEIIRIITALSNEIKALLESFISSEKLIAEIDFHFAKARYAVKTQSIEPDVNSNKEIKIDLMRHPLLIDVVEEIVENDFVEMWLADFIVMAETACPVVLIDGQSVRNRHQGIYRIVAAPWAALMRLAEPPYLVSFPLIFPAVSIPSCLWRPEMYSERHACGRISVSMA